MPVALLEPEQVVDLLAQVAEVVEAGQRVGVREPFELARALAGAPRRGPTGSAENSVIRRSTASTSAWGSSASRSFTARSSTVSSAATSAAAPGVSSPSSRSDASSSIRRCSSLPGPTSGVSPRTSTAAQDLLDQRRHLAHDPLRRELADLLERRVLDQAHDPVLRELLGGCRAAAQGRLVLGGGKVARTWRTPRVHARPQPEVAAVDPVPRTSDAPRMKDSTWHENRVTMEPELRSMLGRHREELLRRALALAISRSTLEDSSSAARAAPRRAGAPVRGGLARRRRTVRAGARSRDLRSRLDHQLAEHQREGRIFSVAVVAAGRARIARLGQGAQDRRPEVPMRARGPVRCASAPRRGRRDRRRRRRVRESCSPTTTRARRASPRTGCAARRGGCSASKGRSPVRESPPIPRTARPGPRSSPRRTTRSGGRPTSAARFGTTAAATTSARARPSIPCAPLGPARGAS